MGSLSKKLKDHLRQLQNPISYSPPNWVPLEFDFWIQIQVEFNLEENGWLDFEAVSSDPSAFWINYPSEYFHDFTKFIQLVMTVFWKGLAQAAATLSQGMNQLTVHEWLHLVASKFSGT